MPPPPRGRAREHPQLDGVHGGGGHPLSRRPLHVHPRSRAPRVARGSGPQVPWRHRDLGPRSASA
eukprot:11805192-Alexandrium_andersonii.AAC.1